jgi:hypothetical protein
LITYGDSLVADDGRSPLAVLAEFLETHLKDSLTGVHILPFFPYTSDDGFAIKDYTAVNPELGGWEDVKRISESFNLMVDLVINHVSSEHPWVQQFQAGEKPGCDYLIEADPLDEQGLPWCVPAVRPLLTKLETVDGPKHVWSTFSSDQIDVDFSNPDVLLEYVKIIPLLRRCGDSLHSPRCRGLFVEGKRHPLHSSAPNPCGGAAPAGTAADDRSPHCHHYGNQRPQPRKSELLRQPQRSAHDLQLQPAAAGAECVDAGAIGLS